MMQKRFTDMQHIIGMELYQFHQNGAESSKEGI
jgi:hypothetical protein